MATVVGAEDRVRRGWWRQTGAGAAMVAADRARGHERCHVEQGEGDGHGPALDATSARLEGRRERH